MAEAQSRVSAVSAAANRENHQLRTALCRLTDFIRCRLDVGLSPFKLQRHHQMVDNNRDCIAHLFIFAASQLNACNFKCRRSH